MTALRQLFRRFVKRPHHFRTEDQATYRRLMAHATPYEANILARAIGIIT